MRDAFDDEELVVDFRKVFEVIKYRKTIIAKTFSIIVALSLVLTFITPKKYISEADLYINKTNNSFLSEINPFMLSSGMIGMGGLGGLMAGGGGGSSFDNEIAIIQSPLVMDKVVRDMNLKIEKGPRKGQYLPGQALTDKKFLSIKNLKGTNILQISYKSTDPEFNYKIVNSIVNNYQKVNEEINTKKAASDKRLLEEAYSKGHQSLNRKISTLSNSNVMPEYAAGSLGMLNALKGHSRVIGSVIGSLKSQSANGARAKIEIDQESQSLGQVKSKLDLTRIIEQMSKSATDVIIIKQPTLPLKSENFAPNPRINLILGAILGLIVSLFAIVIAENKDKSLTYSNLGNKIIYESDIDIDSLKILLLANSEKKVGIITFSGFPIDIFKNLESFGNFKVVTADITPKTADEINSFDKIVMAGKIGKTSKKLYQQIKEICIEKQKEICAELS